jgi:hypothetical protein
VGHVLPAINGMRLADFIIVGIYSPDKDSN